MDSARLKNNVNEVVYEDDLPLMYEKNTLDKDGFICIGCSAKSTPASYKPENLRRPYFRIDNHMDSCDVFKYQELKKTAKKKQISSSSGFPLPYPSKLYLQDKNTKIVDKESPETAALAKKTTNYTQNGDKTNVNTEHHRTSSTIRPIVKHFINFTYDRNIPLSFPIIDSKLNTYNRVFKKISKYNIDIEEFESNYSNTKLYYVPLSVEKNNIQTTNEIISLKLLCGKDESFNLIINISTWNSRKISEVLNELEDLTNKKRKLYKNNQSNKENPHIFRLHNNDFRLYFAKLCNINYPKYK